MSPVFRHGALRLYLLKLLEESPRHGYEVISTLEDLFLGMYSPSAGTIYPRLSRLEAEGLVEHEERDGRKVYRLTDAGRAELDAHRDELARVEAELRRSVKQLAQDVRTEVRRSVRELRTELKQAARDVRRQERVAGRTDAPELAALGKDLSALTAEVMRVARSADDDRVRQARQRLADLRRSVLDALRDDR